MADDDAPYAILGAVTARPSAHGSHVILDLATLADPLSIALPVAEIPPMVALLGQASGQAHAIAGTEPDQTLETVGTEVFSDDQNVDIHFRLAGGLDLPIGLTLRGAAELRDKLAASLAQGSSSGGHATQH